MCMYLHVYSFNMSGPDEAPRNVQVSMHGDGILVTWTPPPTETQNGPLTGYIVSFCGMYACAYTASVCLYMAACPSLCW